MSFPPERRVETRAMFDKTTLSVQASGTLYMRKTV
jgi:hypothetical protein